MTSLQALLAAAKLGTTVVLPPGAYGDQSVKKLSFSPAIVIDCSAATFRSLSVSGCTGLHFTGLAVAFTPDAKTVDWSQAVLIDTCSDVEIAGGKITGGPAIAGGLETDTVRAASDCVIGRPCGYGVNVQHSSFVSITGTEVSAFGRGINLNYVTDSLVQGNDVHDTRRTPIVGAGLQRVVIDGNHLHDVHPWRYGQTPLGDHGDLAAFWTASDQTVASAGLKFTNNRLAQMTGAAILGMWAQGLPSAGFVDIQIDGNTFLLPNAQAVMLKYVQGGSVANNVMVTAQIAGVDPKQRPTVILNAGVSNVTVSGNTASQPISDVSGEANPKSGNMILSGAVAA